MIFDQIYDYDPMQIIFVCDQLVSRQDQFARVVVTLIIRRRLLNSRPVTAETGSVHLFCKEEAGRRSKGAH